MSEQKFEPFQKVLVRTGKKWAADFFSHLEDWGEDLAGDCQTGYATTSGCVFAFYDILPFDEDTKYLLGTTQEPKPIWTPKKGELVAVSDDEKKWFAQVLVSIDHGRYEGAYETSDTHDLSQPSFWIFCEPLHKHFNVPEGG